MLEVTIILLVSVIYMALVAGYVKKSSDAIYWNILFLCWLLMFLTTNSYDLSNYRWAYENSIPHGKEKTYDILQAIAIKLDWNFYVFKLFWQTTTIIFLYKGLKKYTRYKSFLIATFLIVPFLTGFQTQMRSSLSGAIAIYAFPYLFEAKREDIFKYLMWTMLAASIHIMSAFYLIFLIIPLFRVSRRKIHTICIAITLIATPLIHIIFRYTSEIIQIISMISNENLRNILNRLTIYLDPQMRSNLTGFMFNFLQQIIIWFLTYRACKVMICCSPMYRKRAVIICKLNDMMLFLIPFYTITGQAIRLFYYFLPVCYGAIIQYIVERREVTRDQFSETWMLLLLYGTILFVYFVGIYSNPEEFIKIINGIAAW